MRGGSILAVAAWRGRRVAGAQAALIAPLALAQGLHLPLPPAHAGDWALLFQAGIGWVGSLLFFEVLRLAGPVFFSQTGSLVTLWGVFWGWLFFGEALDPDTAMAAGLVLAATLLSLRRSRP